MEIESIKKEITRLLNQLGSDYQASLILRNINDHTKGKVITTEKEVMHTIDTITFLSKKNRKNKETLL